MRQKKVVWIQPYRGSTPNPPLGSTSTNPANAEVLLLQQGQQEGQGEGGRARKLKELPQTPVCFLQEAEQASRLKNQSSALFWTHSAQHQKYKLSTFVFKLSENLYKLSFPQVLPCHSFLPPPPRTFSSALSLGSLLLRLA